MPMRRRTGKGRIANELLEIEMAFLRDEPQPDDPENECYGHWWSMFRDDLTFRPDRPPVAEMWRAMGASIVAEWIQDAPGTRPSVWWTYDSPEPRRRMAGTGQPGWPDLHCGIPNHWSWPKSAQGGTFSGGPPQCDPAGPPVFESEAAYLRRLGLLHDGELERLDAEDFESVPIRVPRHVFCQ